MIEAADAQFSYRVIYSQRVRASLGELIAKARQHGLAEQVLNAVQEIDRRLRLFPQFGEPLVDLTHETGQVWVAAIGPLVVRYAIFEEKRLVIVAVPLQALPNSGL